MSLTHDRYFLRLTTASCLVLSFVATRSSAITLGQVDDFQDGTTMNWEEGLPSSNPPFNLMDGGPSGDGDHALRTVSSGGFGPGAKVVTFNTVQWTGDYAAAGVGGITAMVRVDPSSDDLFLRVGLEGDFANRWVSQEGIIVPKDGQWYPITFPLSELDMVRTDGSQSFDEVFSGVTQIRLLSATGPSWQGSAVPSIVDWDNITAIAVPEPTVGILFLFAFACTIFRSRRRLTA